MRSRNGEDRPAQRGAQGQTRGGWRAHSVAFGGVWLLRSATAGSWCAGCPARPGLGSKRLDISGLIPAKIEICLYVLAFV